MLVMMRAKNLLGPLVKKFTKGKPKPATVKNPVGVKSVGSKIQQDELNP